MKKTLRLILLLMVLAALALGRLPLEEPPLAPVREMLSLWSFPTDRPC